MPLRRYIVIQPDGAEGEEFEVDLPADAPDFTVHPVTKAPCRRVLESPTLTTKYGEGAMKQGPERPASGAGRLPEAGEGRAGRLE